MGKRGPQPKPTALRLLEGNPGRLPLNRREADVRGGMPRPPATLKGAAREEWHRQARKLHRAGLFEAVDRAAFSAYCVAWGTFVEANDALAAEGLTIVAGGKAWEPPDGSPPIVVGGVLMAHPMLGIRNKAAEQIRNFSIHFGLSPSARARLEVPGGSEAQEKPSGKSRFFA